jgi:hypothetical protein
MKGRNKMKTLTRSHMRKKIAFGITAFGLLILGLSLYVPLPRPARAAGLDRSTVESAPAKQEPARQPGLFIHSPSATGDLVGTVTFSQDCGSGIGVGVAYDGAGHLWVSCTGSSNPDLLRASATTGIVDQTYNIKGGLGALAYDATRNALWAGPGCAGDGNVWLIQLDATKSVVSSASQWTPSAGAVSCLDDGIAFDASDDSVYYSSDLSTVIGQYAAVGGALIRSFPWTGAACYNSGLAIGGSLLFQGSDGCSHVWVVDKVTFAPAFDFSTIVPGDPNFRDEGLSCDTETFAGIGKEVMWSKEAFSPNRASAFEIPPGTCGVGGATPTPTPTPTPTAACQAPTSISGNFNAFAIASGNYLWFSSVLKAHGLPSNATVTVTFTNQTITIPGIGSVPVPDATVMFVPGAGSATTTDGGTWTTTVPSDIHGNTFLSGLSLLLPGGLPGSTHPVTWSGTISIDTPGVSICWQWAAANYPTFSANHDALGVKPVDDKTLSIYHNADHAGTPENFKQFVVGGGTGGGGSNFTGSLSATKCVCR